MEETDSIDRDSQDTDLTVTFTQTQNKGLRQPVPHPINSVYYSYSFTISSYLARLFLVLKVEL